MTHYSFGHSTQGQTHSMPHLTNQSPRHLGKASSQSQPPHIWDHLGLSPTYIWTCEWLGSRLEGPTLMSLHLQAQTLMYPTQLYSMGERDFGALSPKQIVVNKSFLSRPRGVWRRKRQTDCKNQQLWITPKKWYLSDTQDWCVYKITETETANKRGSEQSWFQNQGGRWYEVLCLPRSYL